MTRYAEMRESEVTALRAEVKRLRELLEKKDGRIEELRALLREADAGNVLQMRRAS